MYKKWEFLEKVPRNVQKNGILRKSFQKCTKNGSFKKKFPEIYKKMGVLRKSSQKCTKNGSFQKKMFNRTVPKQEILANTRRTAVKISDVGNMSCQSVHNSSKIEYNNDYETN